MIVGAKAAQDDLGIFASILGVEREGFEGFFHFLGHELLDSWHCLTLSFSLLFLTSSKGFRFILFWEMDKEKAPRMGLC